MLQSHLSGGETLAKKIWDRLVAKFPDLENPESDLCIDLGTYRLENKKNFYDESLAELFSYARNSSRATEEVKQAVFEEFNALFPKINLGIKTNYDELWRTMIL